jgi:hemerythrin-like domain-containing protein
MNPRRRIILLQEDLMKEFFELIEKDHQEVKEILEKLEESSDGAVKTREKMFMQLKEEFIPHLKAEEVTLYPALKNQKESRKSALEAIEEHHVAEIVFKELDSLSKNDEVWAAKLKVFKELVEHHIEEEEDQIFKMAQETLASDKMSQIMESFQQEKEKVKKQLS